MHVPAKILLVCYTWSCHIRYKIYWSMYVVYPLSDYATINLLNETILHTVTIILINRLYCIFKTSQAVNWYTIFMKRYSDIDLKTFVVCVIYKYTKTAWNWMIRIITSQNLLKCRLFFCSNRFHSTMIQKIYTTMSKFAKNCRKNEDNKKGLWPSECVLYANIRPLRFLTKIEFMQCYAIIVAEIIIFFKKMLWTVFFNKKHLVCSWQGLAKNNLIWFYIRLTYK